MNAHLLWDFMAKRHAIYERRLAGRAWPWTSDPILKTYRFCNVFRELDTVTMWIRVHWREPYADHPNLWFAMAVARQINWPATLAEIGFPGYNHGQMDAWFRKAKAVMWARQEAGLKVYTGAYMLRGDIWRKDGPRRNDKPTYTLDTVLRSVWDAWRTYGGAWGRGPLGLGPGLTLENTTRWFNKFPGWGGFLSYEVATDLRHTRYLRDAPDILTWANAGPGAVRGLNRIHGRPVAKALSQAQACQEMKFLLMIARNHPEVRWNLRTVSERFAALEMRDIEHSLCEVDKYQRVLLGEGRPRALYRRPT